MVPTDGGLKIAVQVQGARFPLTVAPLIVSKEAKLGPEVTGSGAASGYFGRHVRLSGDTALIGAYQVDGTDIFGTLAADQGSVRIFRFYPITADTDGDGASDAFEPANGFDPTVPGDLGTRDTDQTRPGSRAAIEPGEVANGGTAFTLRFRRSSAAHGVVALPLRSNDLLQWITPGGTNSKSVRVECCEQVVGSGSSYETVELTATVITGSVDSLFVRLQLLPTQ